MGYQHEALIHVSIWTIFLASVPILAIASGSWYLGIGIEGPILVGSVRALVQLSILGMILDPIFEKGKELWILVVLYVLFMITLASYEASARSKYYFKGMGWYIMSMLLLNITIISLFAFGVILHLDPIWDPQYVIPIVGMLLGNCINGVSLSLNAMLTSYVESSREIELMLSFGANSYEATSRLLKEAIRTATMPQLNRYADDGLHIFEATTTHSPGMMTGQILGGTAVTEAARYQAWFTVRVCFDSQKVLRTDRLLKREGRKSLLSALFSFLFGRFFAKSKTKVTSSIDEVSFLAPSGKLDVTESNEGQSKEAILDVKNLTFAFEKDGSDVTPQRRILFQDISFRLGRGEKALVDGPSGVGKSTLLRTLAGLAAGSEGEIFLFGKPQSGYEDMAFWRKQVLYVPQTKVDIPGTPLSFLQTISTFGAWGRRGANTPLLSEMTTTVKELTQQWGIASKLLDSEWRTLSGGESQRVLLAIALASQPEVILLDESSSALDVTTKVSVERSIEDFCVRTGMVAIWITHDHGQQARINVNGSTENGAVHTV
eukprot:scaffold1784_cov116-Cylindrotheca_fusiformis.AAC.7